MRGQELAAGRTGGGQCGTRNLDRIRVADRRSTPAAHAPSPADLQGAQVHVEPVAFAVGHGLKGGLSIAGSSLYQSYTSPADIQARSYSRIGG